MRPLLVTSLMLALLCSGSLAAQGFSSLEERMTAAEFREAGLNKLSAAELRALNEWLRDRGLGDGASGAAASAGAADTTGLRTTQGPRSRVYSHIEGEFAGWSGRTEFHLANGQVWRQSAPGSLHVRLQDPKVEIRPSLISGVWYLSVEGYNTTVKVERIR